VQLSKTMTYYLLRGKRNLSVTKAKQIAALTKTNPIIWIDPDRASERQAAWDKIKK